MQRRDRNRGWLAGLALAATVGLLLPGAAAADTADPAPATDDTGWRLRFYATSVDFHNQTSGGRRTGYDVDVGAALGINAEYRFSRRLGVDIGALAGGGIDLVSRTGSIGQVDYPIYDTLAFSALTAGLDIHLTPDHKVDLYVCPMLALMQYGGIVVHHDRYASVGIDFDEDLALGATLGLSAPFGPRSNWSFNAQLTHLESTLDGSSRNGFLLEEDYDATMFGVGLGYRF